MLYVFTLEHLREPDALSAMAAQVTQVIAGAQAVTLFLTVESFLLATVGLSVTLSGKTPDGLRDMPVSPARLAQLAAGLITIAGIGAFTGWMQMYANHTQRSFADFVIAVILLVALVALPVLAWLLSFGLRFKP